MINQKKDQSLVVFCSELLYLYIFRADAVSPQVADVVEKVMSKDHSLVHNQGPETKPQIYSTSEPGDQEENHHRGNKELSSSSSVQNYSISNSSIHEESNYSLDNSRDSNHSGSPPPSPYYSHDVKSSYPLSPYHSDHDSLPNYVPNKEGIYFCHLCSFSGKSHI